MPTRSKGWVRAPIRDGFVLVGGDAHFWPSKPSTAWKAFTYLAQELKPKIIVMNGDVIDASTISRHPPIGWQSYPSVRQELDCANERLAELIKASPHSDRLWTLGNHDARYETFLAQRVPEYKGVRGVSLKDHFPDWQPAWVVEVGGRNGMVVTHRFKGGHHAGFNNVLYSGRSVTTGHLHRLNVMPYSDYLGTRFGVEGGMLAETFGPQFPGYTEGNPLNWQSGFIVLEFVKGRLKVPETVLVVRKGVVNWRGAEFHV